jgi:hypothetical protein
MGRELDFGHFVERPVMLANPFGEVLAHASAPGLTTANWKIPAAPYHANFSGLNLTVAARTGNDAALADISHFWPPTSPRISLLVRQNWFGA